MTDLYDDANSLQKLVDNKIQQIIKEIEASVSDKNKTNALQTKKTILVMLIDLYPNTNNEEVKEILLRDLKNLIEDKVDPVRVQEWMSLKEIPIQKTGALGENYNKKRGAVEAYYNKKLERLKLHNVLAQCATKFIEQANNELEANIIASPTKEQAEAYFKTYGSATKSLYAQKNLDGSITLLTPNLGVGDLIQQAYPYMEEGLINRDQLIIDTVTSQIKNKEGTNSKLDKHSQKIGLINLLRAQVDQLSKAADKIEDPFDQSEIEQLNTTLSNFKSFVEQLVSLMDPTIDQKEIESLKSLPDKLIAIFPMDVQEALHLYNNEEPIMSNQSPEALSLQTRIQKGLDACNTYISAVRGTDSSNRSETDNLVLKCIGKIHSRLDQLKKELQTSTKNLSELEAIQLEVSQLSDKFSEIMKVRKFLHYCEEHLLEGEGASKGVSYAMAHMEAYLRGAAKQDLSEYIKRDDLRYLDKMLALVESNKVPLNVMKDIAMEYQIAREKRDKDIEKGESLANAAQRWKDQKAIDDQEWNALEREASAELWSPKVKELPKKLNTQDDKLRMNQVITKVRKLEKSSLLENEKKELQKIIKNLQKMRAKADKEYVDPSKVERYAEKNINEFAKNLQTAYFDPSNAAFSPDLKLAEKNQYKKVLEVQKVFPNLEILGVSSVSKKDAPPVPENEVVSRLATAELLKSESSAKTKSEAKKPGLFSRLAKFFRKETVIQKEDLKVETIPQEQSLNVTELHKESINFLDAYKNFKDAKHNNDEEALNSACTNLLNVIEIGPAQGYDLVDGPCPQKPFKTKSGNSIMENDPKPKKVYLDFSRTAQGGLKMTFTVGSDRGVSTRGFSLKEFPDVSDTNWKENHDFRNAVLLEIARQGLTNSSSELNLGDDLSKKLAEQLKNNRWAPELEESLDAAYEQVKRMQQTNAPDVIKKQILEIENRKKESWFLSVPSIKTSAHLANFAEKFQKQDSDPKPSGAPTLSTSPDIGPPYNYISATGQNTETPYSPAPRSPSNKTATPIKIESPKKPNKPN